MRTFRIRIVMFVARMFRVPVSIGYSFMAFGKKAKKLLPGSLM